MERCTKCYRYLNNQEDEPPFCFWCAKTLSPAEVKSQMEWYLLNKKLNPHLI